MLALLPVYSKVFQGEMVSQPQEETKKQQRCPTPTREPYGSLELSLHDAAGIWFKTPFAVGAPIHMPLRQDLCQICPLSQHAQWLVVWGLPNSCTNDCIFTSLSSSGIPTKPAGGLQSDIGTALYQQGVKPHLLLLFHPLPFQGQWALYWTTLNHLMSPQKLHQCATLMKPIPLLQQGVPQHEQASVPGS